MLRRVLVGDNERVLVIRKGRFERILAPGEYWVFRGLDVVLERYNVRALVFAGEWADYHRRIQRPDLAAEYFTVVETRDSQAAVVYLNGRVSRVIGPGKRVLYWRGP